MVALAALLLLAAVSQVAAQAYPRLGQSSLSYSTLAGSSCSQLSTCDMSCIRGGYTVSPQSSTSTFANIFPRLPMGSGCSSSGCAYGIAQWTSVTMVTGYTRAGILNGQAFQVVAASASTVEMTVAGCTLTLAVSSGSLLGATVPVVLVSEASAAGSTQR
jgi:hypothetical protein